MQRNTVFWLGLSAGLFATILLFQTNSKTHLVSGQDAQAEQKPVPVEKSMHEFMEYFFQPTYLRLRHTMAAEPSDNSGWRGIKSDALIFAEGGNLLLLRTPPKDPAKWSESSVSVRDLAAQLYKAARKRDFATARKSYEKMLTSCNACHKQFAGGKHILAP